MADDQSIPKRRGGNPRPSSLAWQRSVEVRRGRPLSPEHRAKLSAINKGRVPNERQRRALIEWNRGRPKSAEVRAKISASLMGRPGATRTDEHKAGVSAAQKELWAPKRNESLRNTFEYRQWRKAVLERDNHTCQRCGAVPPKRLHAHHIKSFEKHPELRYDVSNGRTLCGRCHAIEGGALFTTEAKVNRARAILRRLAESGINTAELLPEKG